MKVKSYIPNVIISILLVFVIIASEALILTKATALNPSICVNILYEQQIADKVIDELNSYFEKSCASTSIPAEVYMSAITKEQVEKSISDGVTSTFDYINGISDVHPTVSYDFTALEQSITEYFEEYAQENDYIEDEKYYAQLNNTITAAETEIISNLDVFLVSMIDSTGLFEKARSAMSILPKANIGVTVCLLILVVLLIIVNGKSKRDLLYWIAVPIFISSIIVAVPTFIIKSADYFSRFTIKTVQVYLTVTELLNEITSTIIAFEIAMFAVSIALFAVYVITTRKKKNS